MHAVWRLVGRHRSPTGHLLADPRGIGVPCSLTRVPRLRVGLRVNRRCGWLSLKRCDFNRKGELVKSNPTRAGPGPFGNLHSNLAIARVRSQRREITNGDGGAR